MKARLIMNFFRLFVSSWLYYFCDFRDKVEGGITLYKIECIGANQLIPIRISRQVSVSNRLQNRWLGCRSDFYRALYTQHSINFERYLGSFSRLYDAFDIILLVLETTLNNFRAKSVCHLNLIGDLWATLRKIVCSYL